MTIHRSHELDCVLYQCHSAQDNPAGAAETTSRPSKTKYLEKPFIEDHFKLLTGCSEAPIIHSCAVILIATLG